ncbi:PREDICTED: IQ motif and SEC7 domain-containing protein 3-like [Charadrius vociferus]|uniref:IQ motif and SEC7 domain-containing protein 3-like n=1 Tax=Charadrius vociferus TaxID=50402 RepID=UPI00052178A9|nr:PREDICTED: IQ motif and SEC7 domain-containing protein 3-like [Charadrius vociferus]
MKKTCTESNSKGPALSLLWYYIHSLHIPQQNSTPHQHPAETDGREKGCCTALLQHKTPQAIGKGVLSRRPENETVLHQFCCPAADAEQKPSSPDSSPSDDPSGSTSKKAGCETEDPKEAGRQSGQEGRSDTLTLKAQHAELQEEQAAGCSPLVQKASLHHTGSPVRVQRSKGTASCSHAAASDYELSLDLKNKQAWPFGYVGLMEEVVSPTLAVTPIPPNLLGFAPHCLGSVVQNGPRYSVVIIGLETDCGQPRTAASGDTALLTSIQYL